MSVLDPCTFPRRRGFTLIELLVVIAIIAVLAAILFPVFAQAKAKAKQSQCLSNTKQLAVGLRLYSDDWNGVYPGAGCVDEVGWVDSRRRGGIETGEIFPYVKSAGVYLCPLDPNLDRNRYSFAMNVCMSRRAESTLAWPSSTVLLLEENENTAGGNTGLNDGCYYAWYTQDRPAVRHNRGGHFVYGDTHTKWHPGIDFRFARTGPERGIGRLWERFDPGRPEEDEPRLPWRDTYCFE